MTVLELHNLLHRAGVELQHRPEQMMRELAEVANQKESEDKEMKGDSDWNFESEVRRICHYYHLPRRPTEKIVAALLNPDMKLLTELRRDRPSLEQAAVATETG